VSVFIESDVGRRLRGRASGVSALVLCAACSGGRSDSVGSSLGADGARDGAVVDAGAATEADGAADEGADAASPDADLSDGADAGDADASTADADAPDADAPDASSDAAVACGASLPGSGCASGQRSGFFDVEVFPDIAACAGAWEGDVRNGMALCGAGFHVCRGSDAVVRGTTFAEASAFCGCYAFDAAQDNYTCLDGCSAQAPQTDALDRLDMAGMGGDCPYRFVDGASCLATGRIDATENDGIGCSYDPRMRGVVCCADPRG